MVGVCCGCIAKPASVQPRKTYNTLVPQLFAGEPIATDEAIDSSMRRKIQKLQEYVQVNPAKIPKVRADAMPSWVWYCKEAAADMAGCCPTMAAAGSPWLVLVQVFIELRTVLGAVAPGSCSFRYQVQHVPASLCGF